MRVTPTTPNPSAAHGSGPFPYTIRSAAPTRLHAQWGDASVHCGGDGCRQETTQFHGDFVDGSVSIVGEVIGYSRRPLPRAPASLRAVEQETCAIHVIVAELLA